MENASKALIMAGSVLLAMLIIATLVFMFNTIRGLEETEVSSEEAQKLAEYNKQIETFNREGLYGSEILSLANLIDDYNIRQSGLKGYEPISFEIYTTGITGADKNTIMQKEYLGDNSYKTLIQDFEKLKDEVDDAKSEVLYGKTIERLSGMRTNELEETLKEYGVDEDKIYDAIYDKTNGIDTKITNYTSKKSEMTEFKVKKFKIPDVEYDEHTGRVKEMIFKEVGID